MYRDPVVEDEFYPSDKVALEEFIRNNTFYGTKEKCSAVFIPYGKFSLCGDIIVETLSRLELPKKNNSCRA